MVGWALVARPTNDRALTCSSAGGEFYYWGSTKCAGISKFSSISIRRLLRMKFELLRYSSWEKSADSTNRRRQTKERSWRRSMKSRASRLVFSVRSKPMRRRRIAKKRPPRRGLAPRRDSVPESACDGDTGLDRNPPAHPTVSGRDGHAGMRGVRVWKDPHIRKEREMCGAPGPWTALS